LKGKLTHFFLRKGLKYIDDAYLSRGLKFLNECIYFSRVFLTTYSNNVLFLELRSKNKLSSSTRQLDYWFERLVVERNKSQLKHRMIP